MNIEISCSSISYNCQHFYSKFINILNIKYDSHDIINVKCFIWKYITIFFNNNELKKIKIKLKY